MRPRFVDGAQPDLATVGVARDVPSHLRDRSGDEREVGEREPHALRQIPAGLARDHDVVGSDVTGTTTSTAIASTCVGGAAIEERQTFLEVKRGLDVLEA